MLISCADSCDICPTAVAAWLPEGHCAFSFKLKTHKYKKATKAEVMLIVSLEIQKPGVFD